MTTNEIVDAIIAKIEELDTDLLFGIRTLEDDENYKIGDTARNSYEWDVENDCSTYYTTGEECDGTCATGDWIDNWDEREDIEVKVNEWIKKNYYYSGAKQVLVFGKNEGSYITRDEGEVRIVDGEVLLYI